MNKFVWKEIHCFALVRSQEKSTNQTFGSGYPRWGGSLPREEAGIKKFLYVARNPGKRNLWAGFPGFLPGFRVGGVLRGNTIRGNRPERF